jgi:hypothetical protein
MLFLQHQMVDSYRLFVRSEHESVKKTQDGGNILVGYSILVGGAN